MGQAKIEGPLSKWTNVMKGWQYRWFVLDDNAGLLSYYTSKEKMMRGARRGCVRLKGAVVGIDDEDDSTFTITVDQKTFHFQARDGDEREKWICALEDTVMRHSQPLRKWETRSTPTLVDFEKKLTETDAFLQLLIDQVEALGIKIDQCEDEAEREKHCLIKITADNMVEAIKQSIVYLQIAKQNAISPLLNGPAFHDIVATREITEGVEVSAGAVHSSPDHLSTPSDTEQGVEFFEDTEEHLPPNSLQGAHPMVQTSATSESSTLPSIGQTSVPETSYSSSEDEDDDFFDAQEDSASPKHATLPKNSKVVEAEEDEKEKEKPIVIKSDDDIFDELYDEDDDEDLESLDKHGSVITHLLSQVRIGMDLTKIVLPTFILERRSLLEMYADFLAHPDLFVGVADFSDPYDRMVQVVRWYLSAFHAGRKSEVAKKPYNPILGETFLCYWDVPDQPKTGKTELNTDGPIPWAYKDNLCFIAEQVSHHPPISAFYAEHANKKVSLDGYIWTKSKFLGLSIGVHMIGQAVLSVIEYDEEYLITFPSGYGRSILTTPWIELGGKCTINCPKSGYSANINFLTKPFYGGKKNQIAAEIYAPDEKKPFCNIQGEWNGVMWAQFSSGRSEKFVDTKNTPIMKKKVQSLEKQGEFESRKLWQDVTYNLKNKNVEKATENKQKLEQRQRQEAKDRKEKGEKWETKHFHEVGEHWVYDHSIMKRLSRKNQEQLAQLLQVQQEEAERRKQEQTTESVGTPSNGEVPESKQADDDEAEDEAEFVDPYEDDEGPTENKQEENLLISLE